MNLSAIFSKTGKGVQEASGKTNHLSRGDRAVLSAIDGKTPLTGVQANFEKLAGPKFKALIQQLDKDGFIREVSTGQAAAPSARPAVPPKAASPPKPASSDEDAGLDFTQAIKIPPRAPAPPAAPKPPPVDLAAAARAESERKAKEDLTLDYRSRQELQSRLKAEAEAKTKADARARVDAEGRARAAAEANAKAMADAAERERQAAAQHERDALERARKEAEEKAKRDAEANAKAMADAAERERQASAQREREALERARKEIEERVRLEAELNAKLDAERKAREETEEKAKRDAEANAKAMADAAERERQAAAQREREALERERKETEDKARLEAELNAKLDAERKAREEAETRAAAAAEQARKELEATAQRDAEALRERLEAEMKEKLEAERKAQGEEERKRRKETDVRRARQYVERRAKEEAEREARDAAEKREKDEAAAKARAAQEASASAIERVVSAPSSPAPAAPAAPSVLGDDLLADLASFAKREEEEQQAREEAERKAKDEAARKARADAERMAQEEADRKRSEEEERRRKEEEDKRAREDEERKAREAEEARKEEEAERKRKAKEALAAKQAAAAKAGGKGDDGIEASDDDLDRDDLKRDQKVAADRAHKVAREQPAAASGGRPKKWGKPLAIGLLALLAGGFGLLHVMPLPTADYEKAAAEALGMPVKIASARLSVITGLEVRFDGVSIGGAVKIRRVRGFPEIASLYGARKAFSRVELEGMSASQSQLADMVLGKVAGENFRVGRVLVRQATLDGPLKLPALDADAVVAGDGSLRSLTLSGGDKLNVKLSPKGGDVGFEISAGSLELPIVPALTLSDFGMKGTANRQGVVSSEFDGRAFDGVISGTARMRWGATWAVEGEVRARALKVAVFAPALVSAGRAEGRGAYSMSGGSPATLYQGARMQGVFKIENGVLGRFNLTRALQTGGAQTGGRTEFSELTGQGVYDKGNLQLANIAIAAGAMNAGATVSVDANGGLSGRILADVKTPDQTLRVALNLSGKLQDPVIRK